MKIPDPDGCGQNQKIIKPLADVIVLCWNNLNTTKQFVDSFFAHTGIDCRLIMIDNASTDGTGDYLRSLKRSGNIALEVILNGRNLGFVEGMNQGIERSLAPYVCLANNDLFFTDGWLEEIISVFESDRRIGVLNPNSNNLGLRPAVGQDLYSLAQQLHREFKGGFAEMPFCIGFCMVIRREVFAGAGRLSEEFSPFYFEDSDFSLKAEKAGYLIGVSRGSYVWHDEHGSLGSLGRKNEEYFARSRGIFRKKWGKILKLLIILDNEKKLGEALDQAITLARGGNFVRIAVKGLTAGREEIFRKYKQIEHSGISFLGYRLALALIWKVLVKKKDMISLYPATGR